MNIKTLLATSIIATLSACGGSSKSPSNTSAELPTCTAELMSQGKLCIEEFIPTTPTPTSTPVADLLRRADLTDAKGLVLTDSSGAVFGETNAQVSPVSESKYMMQRAPAMTSQASLASNTLYKITKDGTVKPVVFSDADNNEVSRGSFKITGIKTLTERITALGFTDPNEVLEGTYDEPTVHSAIIDNDTGYIYLLPNISNPLDIDSMKLDFESLSDSYAEIDNGGVITYIGKKNFAIIKPETFGNSKKVNLETFDVLYTPYKRFHASRDGSHIIYFNSDAAFPPTREDITAYPNNKYVVFHDIKGDVSTKVERLRDSLTTTSTGLPVSELPEKSFTLNDTTYYAVEVDGVCMATTLEFTNGQASIVPQKRLIVTNKDGSKGACNVSAQQTVNYQGAWYGFSEITLQSNTKYEYFYTNQAFKFSETPEYITANGLGNYGGTVFSNGVVYDPYNKNYKKRAVNKYGEPGVITYDFTTNTQSLVVPTDARYVLDGVEVLDGVIYINGVDASDQSRFTGIMSTSGKVTVLAKTTATQDGIGALTITKIDATDFIVVDGYANDWDISYRTLTDATDDQTATHIDLTHYSETANDNKYFGLIELVDGVLPTADELEAYYLLVNVDKGETETTEQAQEQVESPFATVTIMFDNNYTLVIDTDSRKAELKDSSNTVVADSNSQEVNIALSNHIELSLGAIMKGAKVTEVIVSKNDNEIDTMQ